jgi:hemolysin activation/secretion protein
MDSTKEGIRTPLDSVRSSYEEAYNTLKSYSIEYGYSIRLHLSRPHRSNIKTYFNYRYDKSRTYNSQATIRQTSTRMEGCPFSVIITQVITQESNQWQLQVKNGCQP